METLSVILLCWAIVLLVFCLFVSLAYRNLPHRVKPEPNPNPTAAQVQGVVEVYEILGMYEGPIQ